MGTFCIEWGEINLEEVWYEVWFENADNIVFLDLGVDYMGMWTVKINYDSCTFL
jgi:hypothetical protein